MKLETFWDDVEKDLDHILYGDTDSLFVHIKNIKPKSLEEFNSESQRISKLINEEIIKFHKNNIFPKLGVDEKYNRIFFKTEYVFSNILLLSIKKNYAYTQLLKDGKHEEKIKYVGLPIVRSNIPDLSKRFLKDLLEGIALNRNIDITNKNQIKIMISKLLLDYNNIIDKCCENVDFSKITTKNKWNVKTQYKEEPFHIVGLKLYNTISRDYIFRQGVSGYLIPIKIKNIELFENKIKPLLNLNEYCLKSIDYNKLNYLGIPPNYDKNIFRNLLTDFGIEINIDILKELLLNSKSIQKIINLLLKTND